MTGTIGRSGGSRVRAGRPQSTLRERAERRVDNSVQLSKYRDTIFYDWPEGDEHLQWIIIAPIREIIDWVETVKINASH